MISVAIITLNEEKQIKACLDSVSWADEIVVVDAESQDNTVQICRQFTDKIYIRKWAGFAEQKQFALDQCSHEWVLSLDADERVSDELREEIARLIRQHDTADGYLIARRTYFLNKWIRHCGWYPGYQLRLFKREKTRVSQTRVHEGFLVDGRVEKLDNDIIHFSYESLTQSLEKLNRYTSLEALDRMEQKRVYWYDFLFRAFSTFWIKFVAQKGFLDGMHGFLLSWVSTLFKMVLYMKIWHLQRLSPEEVKAIKEATL